MPIKTLIMLTITVIINDIFNTLFLQFRIIIVIIIICGMKNDYTGFSRGKVRKYRFKNIDVIAKRISDV